MSRTKKFFKSFKHAFDGLKYAMQSDQNISVHLVAALLVVSASIWLKVTPFEMAILGVTILVVISAEMVNTAIEKMVDLIVNHHRIEAKIAKDVAAGMVLVTVTGAIIVGILIFAPYIIKLL
jgi:diacylglycerol kinase